MMAVGVTAGVWISYGILLQTSNYDNSLGIYRLSIHDLEYVRLLDISDILSSNGSFVHLEQIPNRELLFDSTIEVRIFSMLFNWWLYQVTVTFVSAQQA